jgi:hypothetical protein
MRNLICAAVVATLLSVGQAQGAGLDGEKGYAWMTKRTNWTREQFAAAIGEDDRRLLRVSSSQYARELGSVGMPSPTPEEGSQALADWLLNSGRIVVVECSERILAIHNMSRTNAGGTKIDYGWQRKVCYPGESILALKSDDGRITPFLSLGCGNIMIEKPQQVVSAPRSTACKAWILRLRPWDIGALVSAGFDEDDLRSAAAGERGYFGKNNSFPRIYGRKAREKAAAGKLRHSRTPHDVVIRMEANDGNVLLPETKLSITGKYDYDVTALFRRHGLVSRDDWVITLRYYQKTLSPPLGQSSDLFLQKVGGEEWEAKDCVFSVHSLYEGGGSTPAEKRETLSRPGSASYVDAEEDDDDANW